MLIDTNFADHSDFNVAKCMKKIKKSLNKIERIVETVKRWIKTKKIIKKNCESSKNKEREKTKYSTNILIPKRLFDIANIEIENNRK